MKTLILCLILNISVAQSAKLSDKTNEIHRMWKQIHWLNQLTYILGGSTTLAAALKNLKNTNQLNANLKTRMKAIQNMRYWAIGSLEEFVLFRHSFFWRAFTTETPTFRRTAQQLINDRITMITKKFPNLHPHTLYQIERAIINGLKVDFTEYRAKNPGYIDTNQKLAHFLLEELDQLEYNARNIWNKKFLTNIETIIPEFAENERLYLSEMEEVAQYLDGKTYRQGDFVQKYQSSYFDSNSQTVTRPLTPSEALKQYVSNSELEFSNLGDASSDLKSFKRATAQIRQLEAANKPI